MFGIETWGEGPKKTERRHGYSAGRIDIEGNQGRVRFWPRRLRKLPGGGNWEFVADNESCTLDPETNLNTRPAVFSLLREVVVEPPPRPVALRFEPILRLRLESLKENLSRVNNLSVVRTKFGFAYDDVFDRQTWRDLTERLERRFAAWTEEVAKIERELDVAEATPPPPDQRDRIAQAWKSYFALREKCQDIFHECLDVIAGLVFREKNFDADICNAADMLIHMCSFPLAPPLTAPSPREALAKTFGRIVRMRHIRTGRFGRFHWCFTISVM